jgi:hypothetical protein
LVRGYEKKLMHAFTGSRTKRYIELLLNGGKRKGVALNRRKRFISKFICDKFLWKSINFVEELCEGRTILIIRHTLYNIPPSNTPTSIEMVREILIQVHFSNLKPPHTFANPSIGLKTRTK